MRWSAIAQANAGNFVAAGQVSRTRPRLRRQAALVRLVNNSAARLIRAAALR